MQKRKHHILHIKIALVSIVMIKIGKVHTPVLYMYLQDDTILNILFFFFFV